MGLDTVELVLLAEKEFELQLPDDEVSLIATVGEFTQLIHQKLLLKHGLGKSQNPSPDIDEIYNTIKKLLMTQFAIPENKITPDARFVDDLRMD